MKMENKFATTCPLISKWFIFLISSPSLLWQTTSLGVGHQRTC
jgi:hypothetical protein